MSSVKKYYFYFVLKCLSTLLFILPAYLAYEEISKVATKPVPGEFLNLVGLIVASLIVAVTLSKYSAMQLQKLKDELFNVKVDLLNSISRTLDVMVYVVIAVSLQGKLQPIEEKAFNAKKNKLVSPAAAQDLKKIEDPKVKFTFQELSLTSSNIAHSYWGTCTFLLIKDSGKLGGTKIFDSVPNCVTQFKAYFRKYACVNSTDKKEMIRTGQLNFGKKLNYQRVPSSGYYIVMTAQCDAEQP